MMRFGTILLLMMTLTSCAGLGTKNPTEMTPTEVAIWANRNYEQQYKAYLQDYELGHKNEAMQEMLKKKRKGLVEIYPLLITFNEIILSGGEPTPRMTDEIIRLVYKLTGIY